MAKTKASTVLERSLILLNGGKRWVKGVSKIAPGETKFGEHGKVYPEGAFCMTGATTQINTSAQDRAESFLAQSIKEYGYEEYRRFASVRSNLQDFNDHGGTTWRDIRSVFNRAIRSAKKAGD